jgi:type IV secretory pathway protease TraF
MAVTGAGGMGRDRFCVLGRDRIGELGCGCGTCVFVASVMRVAAASAESVCALGTTVTVDGIGAGAGGMGRDRFCVLGRDRIGELGCGCGTCVFVASVMRVAAVSAESVCALGTTVTVDGIGAGRAAFFLRTDIARFARAAAR